MHEFVKMAVDQLGVSEAVAGGATRAVLGGLEEKAGADEVRGALGGIDGIGDFLSGGAASGGGGLGGLAGALGGGGGGGGLGGLAGALGGGGGLGLLAAGALGGKAGGAAALAGMLGSTGLDAGQMAPFVKMLLGFLEDKAGKQAVGGLLSKVPELAGLLG